MKRDFVISLTLIRPCAFAEIILVIMVMKSGSFSKPAGSLWFFKRNQYYLVISLIIWSFSMLAFHQLHNPGSFRGVVLLDRIIFRVYSIEVSMEVRPDWGSPLQFAKVWFPKQIHRQWRQRGETIRFRAQHALNRDRRNYP